MPEIISFAATPSTIVAGQSTTLAWNVSGATSLSINQGVGTVTGTSLVVSPTATTVYTLTATNDAGSSTTSTSVIVTPAPPRPVIASFTASPSHVAPGGSATLAWHVTGATSLSIDNGVGTVTGTSVVVTPAATTTYTLTATNANGSVTSATTVTVTTVPLPVFTSFTASPSHVAPGGTVTLAWLVSGATSMSIDNGVGTVTGTSVVVTPAATTTYTMTATNAAGSVSHSVLVTVTTDPLPVFTSFTATPPTIVRGGSSTLAWVVTGATTLSIDQGVGTVTGTSVVVTPAATTTYTMTATNAAGSGDPFGDRHHPRRLAPVRRRLDRHGDARGAHRPAALPQRHRVDLPRLRGQALDRRHARRWTARPWSGTAPTTSSTAC